MNVGMVLARNFPPDVRVEKEARTLIADNHEVHLLAYMRINSCEPPEEYIEGLQVRRIHRAKEALSFFRHLWDSLRFHMTFRSSYWANQIERFARDFKLDVLHVHDLPLVGTAIALGRNLGIPVIADLHENYPAGLDVWNADKRSPKVWITANPKRWTGYEGRAARLASHIIVVVNEAKNRLMKQHGLPAEKITVLMNVEDMDYFQSIQPDLEILARYRDSFVISYIGGGGKHRGLDTAIRAIPYLKEMVPKMKFIIVGLREVDQNRLQELAKDEGVNDLVETIGWQPFSKVPSYIQASEICLVPHKQNPHTDSTIPHKLFQYMLANRPVVVSSCLPLKRIVEETRSGLVFRAGDPHDLAKQIQTLFENIQLRKDCGFHGYQAVLNRYNWAVEGQKLCLLYKSLLRTR